MPEIDFESAVAEFVALGRRMQNQPQLTGDQLVDEYARWYRDVRIEEASVDDSNDMLLLEWGALRPMEISEPTDFRPDGSYTGIQWADTLYKAIQLTRQVVPAAGHEDPQFDDLAMDLSIMLCFDATAASDPGDSMCVGTPDEVDRDVADFREQPYVQPLLAARPQRIVVWLSGAG
jgi:hypothetical protein